MRRVPPRFPASEAVFDGGFNFCRVMYSSQWREAGGQGWSTDYPDADILILLHRSGFKVREVAVQMRASQGASMHSGHRSLYYVYKMSLSILVTLLRPKRHAR